MLILWAISAAVAVAAGVWVIDGRDEWQHACQQRGGHVVQVAGSDGAVCVDPDGRIMEGK